MYLPVRLPVHWGLPNPRLCISLSLIHISKGVQIYVRKVAPLGDPLELTVRNYELSVRKADAEMIELV